MYEVEKLVLKFPGMESLDGFISNPQMRMEFDPTISDSGGKGVLRSSEWPLQIDLDETNCRISVSLKESQGLLVEVNLATMFDVEFEVNSGANRFNDWVQNEGGLTSCCVAARDKDVRIVSDAGQRLFVVDLSTTTHPDEGISG
ncbi:MAG: hypothetical protein IPO43_19310 [Rhodoferax sp.]|nr:hypothetical protein [Rhodoferax sp.]